jgi:hypothetical protein
LEPLLVDQDPILSFFEKQTPAKKSSAKVGNLPTGRPNGEQTGEPLSADDRDLFDSL